MNLWDHLESKSSSVKSQYAFGVASVVTILIAVVWVSTLPARFAQKSPLEVTTEEEEKGFSELFSDTKNQLGNIIQGTQKTDVPEVETNSLDALSMDFLPEESDSLDSSVATLHTTGVIEETSTGTSPSGDISNVGTTTQVSHEPVVTPTTTPLAQPDVSASPRVILIGTTTSLHTDL